MRVLLVTIASLALFAKVSAFGILAPSSSIVRLVDSCLPRESLLRAESGATACWRRWITKRNGR